MMRAFKIVLLFVGLLASTASFASAAQLVMVGARGCVYCAAFGREVVPTYASTKAGKAAPLRYVFATAPWPADLADVEPVRRTPVFILIDKGHEVGRFAGYSSPELFFGELAPLLQRL